MTEMFLFPSGGGPGGVFVFRVEHGEFPRRGGEFVPAFEIDVSEADEANITLGILPQHRVGSAPAEEFTRVEDEDFFPGPAIVCRGRYDRELVFVERSPFDLNVGAKPGCPESAALGNFQLGAALKEPEIDAVLVVRLLSFEVAFDQGRRRLPRNSVREPLRTIFRGRHCGVAQHCMSMPGRGFLSKRTCCVRLEESAGEPEEKRGFLGHHFLSGSFTDCRWIRKSFGARRGRCRVRSRRFPWLPREKTSSTLRTRMPVSFS